eukprot:2328772-Pleurochrysis_carterae.AAC.1
MDNGSLAARCAPVPSLATTARKHAAQHLRTPRRRERDQSCGAGHHGTPVSGGSKIAPHCLQCLNLSSLTKCAAFLQRPSEARPRRSSSDDETWTLAKAKERLEKLDCWMQL